MQCISDTIDTAVVYQISSGDIFDASSLAVVQPIAVTRMIFLNDELTNGYSSVMSQIHPHWLVKKEGVETTPVFTTTDDADGGYQSLAQN